jgi:hypothetical protein
MKRTSLAQATAQLSALVSQAHPSQPLHHQSALPRCTIDGEIGVHAAEVCTIVAP